MELLQSKKCNLEFYTNIPQFFIVGAQRSGTTLLRLLLNSHSKIAIPEESSFLFPYLTPRLMQKREPLSSEFKSIFFKYILGDSQFKKWKMNVDPTLLLLEKNVSLRHLIGFLYYQFALQNGKTICGDKNPKFIRKLGLIADAYPKSKFIHLVRDGRDTYLSFKKKGHPSADSIAVAALEWKTKNNLCRKLLDEHAERSLCLRYEDLLQAPEDTLQEVCTFLSVDYEAGMLDFWKSADQFIDKQHSELIFKPIEPKNIGKWKESFTRQEASAYTLIAGKTLQTYNYSLNSKEGKLAAKERLQIYFDLALNLPKRIIRIAYINIIMKIASKYGLSLSLRYYK